VVNPVKRRCLRTNVPSFPRAPDPLVGDRLTGIPLRESLTTLRISFSVLKPILLRKIVHTEYFSCFLKNSGIFNGCAS
jgi:hypothetical protein